MSRIAAGLLIGLAASYSIVLAAAIVCARPERRVQYVPDDAFYYLTLARNFATQGHWTFDSGVSVTSGFHLLHAYALAGIFLVFSPSPEAFVRVALLGSYAIFLVVLVAAARYVWRTERLYPALIFFLFVLSRNTVANEVSAMEWTWVVAISALMFAAFGALDRERSTRAVLILSACGLAGSLARSDFGWQPAALLLACFAVPSPSRDERRRRILGAAAALGASIVGTLIVIAHNRVTTGAFLQSSARMKLLWLDGHPSIVLIVAKCVSLIGPVRDSWRLATIALAVVSAGLVGQFLWSSRGRVLGEGSTDSEVVQSRHRVLCVASVAICVGYVGFYAFDGALQSWYTANLIVAVFTLMVLPSLHLPRRDPMAAAAAALAALLIVPQAWGAIRFFREPPIAIQVGMYRAGLYLQHTHLDRRVGSWNAGIVGFYQGGAVINLDGLVNNDIYEYARTNRLEDYVDRESIGYIVDSDFTLNDDNARRRGGYDSPRFLARFEPLIRFTQSGDTPTMFGSVTLFRIRP